MTMAQRIKERRCLLGLTQEELGGKLGLQKSAIAKYENGRVENMKRSIIAKMADVLECSPAYLMGWSDNVTEIKAPASCSLIHLIQKEYGEDAAAALSLYVQLDGADRLRINERMQTLLEDEKYTSQKAKRGQSPA